MPFRAKSFSNAHYHRERLETMEEDDKLASFILATNWSRGQGKAGGGSILRTQTFDSKDNVITVENRQLESHLDCVAVTWVEDRWYVASNRIKLIHNDVVLGIQASGCNPRAFKYEIVSRGGDKMHAEMKILKRLEALGKLDKCSRIGVSKPCCLLCANVLYDLGIDYTSFHTVNVKADAWVDPELS